MGQNLLPIRISQLNRLAAIVNQDDLFIIERSDGTNLKVPASLVLSPGEENTGDAWSSTTTYADGDLVSFGDLVFISQQDDNTGNSPNPANDTTYWHKATNSESNGGLSVYTAGLYTKFSLVYRESDDSFYYSIPSRLPFESTTLDASITAGDFRILETGGGGDVSIIFTATLPVTGVIDTLYVNTTNNTLHYWNGAEYVNLGGSGTPERPNMEQPITANNQTANVDFDDIEVRTFNFADGINTFTVQVDNISTTERYNTIVIDNSDNNTSLNVTFNDQAGAITYRRARNDFPGIYPTMDVAANSIWEISFENRSSTVVLVEFIDAEQ